MQYACILYETSKDDSAKFNTVFTNRIQYTEIIHAEVKEWVGENVERWKLEKPEWFVIELVPDEFLPREVFVAEGGVRRRRSIVSLREVVGLDSGGRGVERDNYGRVHPKTKY